MLTQVSTSEDKVREHTIANLGVKGLKRFSKFSYFEIILQKLVKPTTITKWGVVNFSVRRDRRGFVRDLMKCGQMKETVSFLHIIA